MTFHMSLKSEDSGVYYHEQREWRTIICRGDECGGCRNQKTLGPIVLEYNGESRTVCCFANSDIREFNENTVDLIRQYERMRHEHYDGSASICCDLQSSRVTANPF